MSRAKEAVPTYREDFNCSQAVCSAFARDFGLDRDKPLKISCCLGGGMGRTGDVCGAVTGAFLVLGMAQGMIDSQRQEAKERTYRSVGWFRKTFLDRFGTISCPELLGVDIGRPEGVARAQEEGLMETVCVRVVAEAVLILEEALADES